MKSIIRQIFTLVLSFTLALPAYAGSKEEWEPTSYLDRLKAGANELMGKGKEKLYSPGWFGYVDEEECVPDPESLAKAKQEEARRNTLPLGQVNVAGEEKAKDVEQEEITVKVHCTPDNYVGVRASYTPQDQHFIAFIFKNGVYGPKFGVKECWQNEFSNVPDPENPPQCSPLMGGKLYDIEYFYVLLHFSNEYFKETAAQTFFKGYEQEAEEISYVFSEAFYHIGFSVPFFYHYMMKFENMVKKGLVGNGKINPKHYRMNPYSKADGHLKPLPVDKLRARYQWFTKWGGRAALLTGAVALVSAFAQEKQQEAYELDVTRNIFIESSYFERQGILPDRETYYEIVQRPGQSEAQARQELYSLIPGRDEEGFFSFLSDRTRKLEEAAGLSGEKDFKMHYKGNRHRVIQAMINSIKRAVETLEAELEDDPKWMSKGEELVF